ncbi:MAG TPA: hypothetical protein VFP49_08480, partial [Nitrososphaeraceae archaeon]|nr:hypothetical protein [Nitrososphaeraceae archaeon]
LETYLNHQNNPFNTLKYFKTISLSKDKLIFILLNRSFFINCFNEFFEPSVRFFPIFFTFSVMLESSPSLAFPLF